MKTSFLIKNSWVGIFDRLSDKQAGMLIKMLGHYNVEGGVPEGMNDEVVNAYFHLMKLEIDAQESEPENAEKKRGAPKGSRNNPNGRKCVNKTNSELNKTNSELVNFENAPHVNNQ